MPPQLKRLYVLIVLILGALSAFIGYSVASQQQSTGPAIWQTDATDTITGLLRVDPYPVLHRIDPDDGKTLQSILLVKQGKHSADDYTRGFKDTMVSVTGFAIARGKWEMLEMASETAIQAINDSVEPALKSQLLTTTEPTPLGPISVNGEVIDSKCFLGVMKPGSGGIHKACAEVCLRGGIPAMLLVRGEDEQKYGYMLTGADGSSVSKEVSIKAADHVAVSGQLVQRGSLLYITLAEPGLRG